MSTIKNRLFNKIIKGPGTTFQTLVLRQNEVGNVCHTAHFLHTKFHFGST